MGLRLPPSWLAEGNDGGAAPDKDSGGGGPQTTISNYSAEGFKVIDEIIGFGGPYIFFSIVATSLLGTITNGAFFTHAANEMFKFIAGAFVAYTMIKWGIGLVNKIVPDDSILSLVIKAPMWLASAYFLGYTGFNLIAGPPMPMLSL
jgi:hypothetical protein